MGWWSSTTSAFRMTAGTSAVAHLTFTADLGETIALAGATGAGKSTALALLYRCYDPLVGGDKN